MNKHDASLVVGKILSATRGIADPVEQVKVGSKVLRETLNGLAPMPDDLETEVQRLRQQVTELNTQLMSAECGVLKRVNRNIELVKENYRLKTKSA